MPRLWCIDITVINEIWCCLKCYGCLCFYCIYRSKSKETLIIKCQSGCHYLPLCSLGYICLSPCKVCRVIFCKSRLFRLYTAHLCPTLCIDKCQISYLCIFKTNLCICSPRTTQIIAVYNRKTVCRNHTVTEQVTILCGANITSHRSDITGHCTCTVAVKTDFTSIKYDISATENKICVTFDETILEINICRGI